VVVADGVLDALCDAVDQAGAGLDDVEVVVVSPQEVR
jgi:hypothetical protein